MSEIDYLQRAREALEKANSGWERTERLKREYDELEKKKQALKELYGWGEKPTAEP
jgi:hypothetical protein